MVKVKYTVTTVNNRLENKTRNFDSVTQAHDFVKELIYRLGEGKRLVGKPVIE